jgi:hypothetical protein
MVEGCLWNSKKQTHDIKLVATMLFFTLENFQSFFCCVHVEELKCITVFSEHSELCRRHLFSTHKKKKQKEEICHIGNFLKIKNCPTWLEIWVTKTMVQVTSVCRFADYAHFQVLKIRESFLASTSYTSRISHQKSE